MNFYKKMLDKTANISDTYVVHLPSVEGTARSADKVWPHFFMGQYVVQNASVSLFVYGHQHKMR